MFSSASYSLIFFFRYSYNFTENWVTGVNHILKATVALLSRNIIVQGNLTLERVKLLDSCQEAGAAEGRNTIRCKTQRVNVHVLLAYQYVTELWLAFFIKSFECPYFSVIFRLLLAACHFVLFPTSK